MGCFTNETDVYDHIGRLLRELTADDELGPKLGKANTIIQYQYRDPDCQITMQLDDEQRVEFGTTDLVPDLVLTMGADTAHKFWLGRINPPIALARGQIKISGNAMKVMQLLPLLRSASPRYRAMLQREGRQDLLDAR